MSDPYCVLGVDRRASAAEIKAAYRRRMRQVHPDQADQGDPEAIARAVAEAQAVNAAYAELTRDRPPEPEPPEPEPEPEPRRPKPRRPRPPRSAEVEVGATVVVQTTSGERTGRVVAIAPDGAVVFVRLWIKARGRARRLSKRTVAVERGAIGARRTAPVGGLEVGAAVIVTMASGAPRTGRVVGFEPGVVLVRLWIEARGKARRLSTRTLRVRPSRVRARETVTRPRR